MHPSTTPSQTSNEPINVALGGSELKVLYKPNISPELKAIIDRHLCPSLESLDGSSRQYEPSELAELVADDNEVSSSLSEIDLAVVDALNKHYDYIEI